jgi:hypothetical protein
MSSQRLRLVKPDAEPPLEARILAGMDERDRLRRELSAIEQDLGADVRTWSYAQGYRVPLRPEQARAVIISPGKGDAR